MSLPPGIALICSFNGTHKEFSQQTKLLSRERKKKITFPQIRKLCDKINFVSSFDLLLSPVFLLWFFPTKFLPTHISKLPTFFQKISRTFVSIDFCAVSFGFYLLSKLRLIVAFDSPRSFLHQQSYIGEFILQKTQL